jgi:regulator of ribonuclease activity B
MLRTKKPRIGDIYEIRVLGGLAYFQYTHDSQVMGHLVRVLPSVYSIRPTDFASLARQQELYFIFLTLVHALRQKEVELVSNQPVPGSAQRFPIMRKVAGRDPDGKIVGWLIGHGLRLYTLPEIQQALHVRELTQEQRKLSLAQLWPASTLAMKIERGWLPELAEEFEDADRKKAAEREAQAGGAQPETRFIDHYLYFPKRSNAEHAAHPLRNKGWTVEVKKGADHQNWLALAKQPAPIEEDIEDIRDELERLAKEFDGEYDGWSAAV